MANEFRQARWRRVFAGADGEGPVSLRVESGGEAAMALRRFAQEMPTRMRGMLSRIGYQCRKKMREAVDTGRAGNQTWDPLSRMTTGRTWARLKRGKALKRAERWSKYRHPNLDVGNPRFFGRVGKATIYAVSEAGDSVQMGFIGSRTAVWYAGVAQGLGGAHGFFDQPQSQPVTKAMRRALAAMGFPTAKYWITRKQRQLVGPVWESFKGDIPALVTERMGKIGGGA